MTSFAFKVIRFGFSRLEALSPRLSGSLAFKLFCRTPGRQPKGEKAKRVFMAGQQTLKNAALVRLPTSVGNVGTYHLASGTSPRGTPRLLVVHGWGSRAEYLVDLALGLSAAGAEVVLLDLPGHGVSSGRRLDLRLAAEAIGATERHFGPFDGVVGHSFGGAAVMTAAGGVFGERSSLRAERIVLIGAPSSMGEVFAGFASTIGLGRRSMAAMRARAEQYVGVGVEQLDTVTAARRIDRPLLVVHAEDDKEVNVGHAQRYIGLSPKVRHLWANGHGHRRIVSAPEVIGAVADFLVRDPANDASGHRAVS